MAQHYTSATVSDSKWCNKCKRFTQHAVSADTIGHCLECAERKEKERAARPQPAPAAIQTGFAF